MTSKACVAAMLMTSLMAPSVRAITVTKLTDSSSAVANDGSLRGAVLAANAAGGLQSITFNIPGGGVITLAANASGTRMLPVLTNTAGITIDGSNGGQGGIIIDGGSTSATTGDRILFAGLSSGEAAGSATPNAIFTLTNLTLRNGNARGGTGTAGGGGGAGLGGAVFVNAGTLVVNNVTFSGNRATGGDAAAGANGGGGGMGGNGGAAVGGGGGFGLGATGGYALPSNQTQAAIAGSFPLGTGGNGQTNGIMGGSTAPGGANGGGGGGGVYAGGGGVGGGNWRSMGGGQVYAELRGGSGGFGGGGGASSLGNSTDYHYTGIGGSGGYGGGGGNGSLSSSPYFGDGKGGTGGFGGGGGTGYVSGKGGFGGGDGTSTLNGSGGGGAGMGGAIFVRAGAGLSVTGTNASSGNTSAGGASGGFPATNGQGLGATVMVDAWSGGPAVTTATDVTLDANCGVVTGFSSSSLSTKLTVKGTVNLGGATLHLIPIGKGSVTPATNTVFTVIDNDGTDPIQGAFADLAEGAVVTFNGIALTASYIGGTGNDFTLSSVASSPPTLTAVSGGSGTTTTGSVSCTVNPNGLATTVALEYGSTTAYGTSVNMPLSPADGTSPQNLSANLSGLSSGSTYHYRITASNSAGAVSSGDQTFMTQYGPALSQFQVSSITNSGAQFTVYVTYTTSTIYGCGVDYGTTTSYGDGVTFTGAPILSSGYFSGFSGALAPNTTYHYRFRATNSYGTTYSADNTFTTLAAQPGWRQQYFGTTANSGSAADNADPDKDGIPNLVEWGCNLNPKAASVMPAAASNDSTSYSYVYTRSVEALSAGASFVVEWNDSLGAAGWRTTGVVETIVSDSGTTQQVSASVPAPSGPCFMRLRVTAPP